MKEPTCMEEEFGPINYQCWICPECGDDHLKGRSCSPKSDKPFSPSLDDHSYIAEKYRELEAKLALAEELLERAKEVLRYYGNYMNYSVDYDTSQMGFSRRCILYGDIEQRNEMTGLAGMRARKALKDLAALGEE